MLLCACGGVTGQPQAAAPAAGTAQPLAATAPLAEAAVPAVPPGGKDGPCAAAMAEAGSQQAGQGATAQPAASDTPVVAGYNGDTDTIELRAGAPATLATLSAALNRPAALRELAPGEWLLAANLRVEQGATLRIAAPEARWLKLRSDDHGFVSIRALGGQIEFDGTCVSSWDTSRGGFDENYADGRSFVLARDGARMDIRGSELRYLGYDANESYGISWRMPGTTGSIVDSYVSHNYYGLYSYEVADLVIRGNEVDHNVLYGIDPHTRSVRLLIENNIAHHNGKHGIILAEECSDGVVRNNVAYDNLHHGIVIFQRSNNNLVDGNTSYRNGGQGININDASGNMVRDNTVYENLEVGIGVGQRASGNQVVGNTVRANRKDGIALYSEAQDNALHRNTVNDNARYGVYVKSEGGAEIEGNEIVGNTVGVYLNAVRPPEVSRETNRIEGNHEADVRAGDDQVSADLDEDRP